MKIVTTLCRALGPLFAGAFLCHLSNTTAPSPIEQVERRTVFYVEPQQLPSTRTPAAILAAGTAKEPLLVACEALDAMQASDFDRWMATWDSGGQLYYSERAERDYGAFPRRTESDWKETWNGLFRGNETVITAWTRTPSFAVVCYEIRRPRAKIPPGSPGLNATFDANGVLRSRMVLAHSGGRWLQTGRFAGHPVFQGWRVPGASVVVRASDADWREEQAWPPEKNR